MEISGIASGALVRHKFIQKNYLKLGHILKGLGFLFVFSLISLGAQMGSIHFTSGELGVGLAMNQAQAATVCFCHATGSQANPFNTLCTSNSGQQNGHTSHGDPDFGCLCGDGFCDANDGETCGTCPQDCGACPTCGDGNPDDGEECGEPNLPACTNGEICDGCRCTPPPPDCFTDDDCDDNNPCTDDACNGQTGTCSNTELGDGTSCSDGDLCNGSETCQMGSCTDGTAVVCDDGRDCSTDSCLPESGLCDFDVSQCGCDTDDDCDDGNPCSQNLCDVSSGTCSNPPDNAGDCSDGQFCNGSESCVEGSCVSSGDPCLGGGECADLCDETLNSCNDPQGISCTDDGNECTDNVCDGQGTCAATNNTAACTDSNPCTVGDQCAGGSCNPGTAFDCDDNIECTIDSCSADPITGDASCDNDPSGCDCVEDTDCDDGNACTDQVCNDQNECVYTNNTDPCDDGIFCNGTDVCSGGSCGHSGDPCSQGGECADNCNEELNSCNDPQGTSCTDDGNVCTDNLCNGSGECVAQNNAANCDDNDPCTVDDQCAGGACGSGTPFDCNDFIACTVDTCSTNPDTGGALCTNDAAGCDCTQDSDCDDGNACTDQMCNDQNQCVYTNNTDPCDDGMFCNGTDVCSGGSCGHSGDPCSQGGECADHCDEEFDSCNDSQGTTCSDDGNVCTNNVCDGLGACVPENNQANCDDEDPCTVNDVCSEGTCNPGSAFNCSDGIACTVDSCDGSSGSPVCLNDTGGCECTVDNQCDDNNPCTANTCDENFTCATVLLIGESCNDGNLCTESDLCNEAGACGGTAVDCNDGLDCSTDACNPDNGQCENNLSQCECLSDGECNDGNPCTDDVCGEFSGLCQNLPLNGDINGDGVFDCEGGAPVTPPDSTGGGGEGPPVVAGFGNIEGSGTIGCALDRTAKSNANDLLSLWGFLSLVLVIRMTVPFRRRSRIQ